MAKKWSELTQEEKDRYNANRRAKRQTLSPEELAKVREEDRKRKPSTIPTTYPVPQPDGSVIWADNPKGARIYYKFQAKINRHKALFKGRCAKINRWIAEGRPFPPPGIREHLETVAFYKAVLRVLGCKCSYCGWTPPPGPDHMINNFWRVTRKDDFFAFVGHRKPEYQRILRNPADYTLYCLWCSQDLRLRVYCWLFSPYSARRGGEFSCSYFLGKYASLAPVIEEMYPVGDEALRERIRSGRIRSLLCEITNVYGEVVRTMIIVKQYHMWAFDTPRQCLGIPGYTPYVDDHGKIFEKGSTTIEEKAAEAGAVHADVGPVQLCA